MEYEHVPEGKQTTWSNILPLIHNQKIPQLQQTICCGIGSSTVGTVEYVDRVIKRMSKKIPTQLR